MSSRILLSVVVLIFHSLSFAQPPSPKAYLGYELGDQFTRHYQVIDYFKTVENTSPKVSLEYYGKTYEDRQLILAFVSSEENLAQLETIREDNLRRAGLLEGEVTTNVPIIWLSYNVHGNESVSTEAAIKTIYELVKSDSDKSAWLEKAVVVIDPCLNPDGRERYINFYWQYGNQPLNTNPDSWEHNEPWPGGRPNHYLFDLNRDWAWMTQVETKQRIAAYNKWLPQIHVDFHEQGINSPYYFAPAAEPFHELITDWQREFQTQIGRNHARYFDENKWLYFTKQYFDLLYPSYGDTYPTYNGAIGMTYEQAGHGRAGLGIETETGAILTLKDRINHHFTTGLSTIEVSVGNRVQLLEEFGDFFKKPSSSKYKSYVLKYDGNDQKMYDLMSWLDALDIKYGTSSGKQSGYHYSSKKTRSFSISGKDLVVTLDQPKAILASVLFEPETKLSDSLTYDITAWSVPFAFGLEAYAMNNLIAIQDTQERSSDPIEIDSEAYAYVFDWESLSSAKMLSFLLDNGVKVRYSSRPIRTEGVEFKRGAIVVTGTDNIEVPDMGAWLKEGSQRFSVDVVSVSSGFVTSGPDLGSNGDVSYLDAPRVALVGGPGVSSLDFGATWHFFEQELDYPVTTIATDYFSRVDLSKYDVLILQNGRYSDFDSGVIKKVEDWVSNGGKLILVQRALEKVVNTDFFSLKRFNDSLEETNQKDREEEIAKELRTIPASQRDRYEIRDYVAGAVFNVQLDNTNPLAFGYPDDYFSLKTSARRYALLPSGNVGYMKSESDHLSGFAGQFVKKSIPNSLVFGVEYKGRGKVIYLVDNPLFRSFWYNGKLLFANAVFF